MKHLVEMKIGAHTWMTVSVCQTEDDARGTIAKLKAVHPLTTYRIINVIDETD